MFQLAYSTELALCRKLATSGTVLRLLLPTISLLLLSFSLAVDDSRIPEVVLVSGATVVVLTPSACTESELSPTSSLEPLVGVGVEFVLVLGSSLAVELDGASVRSVESVTVVVGVAVEV